VKGVSLRFREVMTDYVTYGALDDWPTAAIRTAENRMRLKLTVEIDDLDRFAADPDREATITGRVEWEPLGGRLPIERGVFNLLVGSEDDHRKRMRYRLFFRDSVGHPVTLVGEKRVGAPGYRIWSDTTTLYVRILSGHVDAGGDSAEAELLAAGTLHLHPFAFAYQLTTFRASGRSRAIRIGAIARFDALFLRQLWRAYGPAALRQ
jgi:cholesterol oxidase